MLDLPVGVTGTIAEEAAITLVELGAVGSDKTLQKFSKIQVSYLQLYPHSSNFQGKLKLLRVKVSRVKRFH